MRHILPSRLQDTEIGVYKTVLSPSFPVHSNLLRIEVFYAPLKEQLDYIARHPDRTFELSVRGSLGDWSAYADAFSELKNVKGLGGSDLKANDIYKFSNIERLFLGNDCEAVSFAAFPNLVSLSISRLDCLERITSLTNLKSLQISPTVKSSEIYDHLRELSGLESLYISEGSMKNLNFLTSMKELKFLNIEIGPKLFDIFGIADLQKLEFCRLDRLKKVLNWSPILSLPCDVELSILECGTIDLLNAYTNCEVLKKANLYGTKLV